MNKAFIREPDGERDLCPRCGSEGERVGRTAVEAHVAAGTELPAGDSLNFCPSAACTVVYFDVFGRTIGVAELRTAVYPKDPQAPICACFGFTVAEIEADIAEGVATRTRALIEKSKSPAADCARCAVNGRSCVPFVQKVFLSLRQS